jgi:hypothetical protein
VRPFYVSVFHHVSPISILLYPTMAPIPPPRKQGHSNPLGWERIESVGMKSCSEINLAFEKRSSGDDGFPAFPVPHRSPSASVFGDEFHREDYVVARLPSNIQSYLDDRGLEAYFVPPDGNCLFRALTFGPEWSKHDLARAATAAYCGGLKQSDNVLAMLLDDAHVEKIRKGTPKMDFVDYRWRMVGQRYWTTSVEGIC